VQVISLGSAMQAGSGVVERHVGRYVDYEDQAFAALNTALMEDGALIHIRKDAVVEQSIHLLFVSTTKGAKQVTHPRNLIVAEANSQATIVESYVGLNGDAYFTNAVTELVAGENAVLDHYKIERESVAAFHIATLRIHQERNSNVTSHAVSLGGALVRNDIHTVLDGEGCECTLNGLYMIVGSQHVDNHLLVDHAKPHCNSRENFKGILDQNSRGVFSGRIIVRQDAQKTDAKQSNMSLLLSEGAQVESKPQLEILADDVKCTHGATIGQISEEAIFYLRSRGISEEAARSLLVYAFAQERVEQIRIDALRTQLEALLFAKLQQGELLREAL
jgi:Fe-S cluster assembly protein SufD